MPAVGTLTFSKMRNPGYQSNSDLIARSLNTTGLAYLHSSISIIQKVFICPRRPKTIGKSSGGGLLWRR
jgi:hypothetical protein